MGIVQRIEVMPVAVPLDEPVAFANRHVSERHYLLVRIIDHDGNEGVGFCYAGHAGSVLAAEAVTELLAPHVESHESFGTVAAWDRMYKAALLHGRAGVVMRAISAVDIGLWDLNAKASGLPLWKYLGGGDRSRVPAYASGGYYLPGKTPEMLADEAESYVAAGFNSLKIKVGRASPSEDLERLAAVRRRVGDHVRIMLDANNAWRDLPDALEALRFLEPLNPYWIEEPFSPDDITNHARLAKKTRVPVATGEIEAGRWRHLELLKKDAVAILQTDAAVGGGITEFLRVASLADSYGVGVAPHWFHDLHVHLVASISNGLCVEYFPDDSVLNFRRLLDHQIESDGSGNLMLPDRPGLGFGWDLAAVERYALRADWERR